MCGGRGRTRDSRGGRWWRCGDRLRLRLCLCCVVGCPLCCIRIVRIQCWIRGRRCRHRSGLRWVAMLLRVRLVHRWCCWRWLLLLLLLLLLLGHHLGVAPGHHHHHHGSSLGLRV